MVKRQSVSSVINQIGICGDSLAVSGTLFAFMFRSTKGAKWKQILWGILTGVFVIGIIVMSSLAANLHIAFSVLAYLVVGEILMICWTALIFTRKEVDKDGTTPTAQPNQITPVPDLV